jgi:hypothetical protein
MSLAHRKARISLAPISNPFFSRDHPETATNPKTVTAAVNVNTDAITALRSRRLLDDAEYRAALAFQAALQIIEGGGLRGSSLRERVDGDHRQGGFGDREVVAGKLLRETRELIGARQYELLKQVCGRGCGLRDLPDYSSNRMKLFAADLLRLSLGDLAAQWGYARR